MNEKEWDDLDRKYLTVMGRWFWLTVIMVVATFLWFSPAFAQAPSPQVYRAMNGEECMLFADYGLTSRALVIAGLPMKKRLDILELIYPMIKDQRLFALAKMVRVGADKSSLSPQEFAIGVFNECMKNEGDISSVGGPAT